MCRTHPAALACGGLEHGDSEASAGVSHGEGSRSCAVLGLDDLVTTELDAVGQLLDLGLVHADRGLALADERDDGHARVAADDGDAVGERLGGLACRLGDEGGGAHDVEGGHTEEAARRQENSCQCSNSDGANSLGYVGFVHMGKAGSRSTGLSAIQAPVCHRDRTEPEIARLFKLGAAYMRPSRIIKRAWRIFARSGMFLGAKLRTRHSFDSPLGVKDTLLLEDLCDDGDGRVDGVGDDENESLGCGLCDADGDVADNAGVDVEEVITGHSGLEKSREREKKAPTGM